MTLNAVGDLILVEPIFDPQIGSIIIPEKLREQKSDFCGIVHDVGPEYPWRDEVKPGDKVRFTRNEGREVLFDGNKYISLAPRWVTAKYEEEG